MEKVSFNLNELGIKAKSKTEIYKLLTVEGSLYLPPISETSTDFILEIIRGSKKVIVFSLFIFRH